MLTASKSTGASFEPLEAGTHPAVCYGLVDIGEQYNETYKKSSRKCIVLWEVIGQTFTDKDGKERNRSISQTYTLALNEKSNLYRDLISWRGKPFTDEELRGFNLCNIVGAPCLLSIVHTEKNGNTYANISGIMKMPKGMVAAGQEEKVIFDLDENKLCDMAKLPEWIQQRIMESVTYKERAEAEYSTEPETEVASAELYAVDDGDGQLPF